MTNSTADLCISGLLTQIILRGAQEFIGQANMKTLAERSQVELLIDGDTQSELIAGLRYAEINALQQALVELYGAQGSLGVAMRSGRAALCYFLKEFGEEGGFYQLDFRLMPPRRRILSGLERSAAIVGRETGQTIQIQTDNKSWIWRIGVCPECWKRENSTAMCYFTVGLLQEFLSWMSGGRIYLVEEIACHAKGDPACVFRIDKKPLD